MNACKAQWAHALINCAKNRYLAAQDEATFRATREILLEFNRTYLALLVTLDLQFWYIVSDQFDNAVKESEAVRACLPAVPSPTHRDAIVVWLHEIDQMSITYRTAEKVLTQVRMVGKPKNLRNLIPS